jgi:outer membrane protein
LPSGISPWLLQEIKDQKMNKILIGVNAVLVVAVAFLFYKVNTISDKEVASEEKLGKADLAKHDTAAGKPSIVSAATPPTGKIAFINIDILNEQCQEVNDLVAEAKSKKANIEASVQSLSVKYQAKMEEYQRSAKAGIAPQSQLDALAKEIQSIEKEAQNKQLQMDNLSDNIGRKNADFQTNLKEFLVRWNDGRYDYILSYSDAVPTMLLGNASLDITREVIDKVNEEYRAKKADLKKIRK